MLYILLLCLYATPAKESNFRIMIIFIVSIQRQGVYTPSTQN